MADFGGRSQIYESVERYTRITLPIRGNVAGMKHSVLQQLTSYNETRRPAPLTSETLQREQNKGRKEASVARACHVRDTDHEQSETHSRDCVTSSTRVSRRIGFECWTISGTSLTQIGSCFGLTLALAS